MAALFSFADDLRFGARSLASRPTFAVVVTLTLALGIGVNVAVFALFEQILAQPLPVAEPETLVNLNDPGSKQEGLMRGSAAGGPDSIFSYPMFRDLERAREPFIGIAAHRSFVASLAGNEQAQRATGMFVSGSYFSLLGLKPTLGRLLGPQDDRVDGEAHSVVLSHAHWQSAYGGAPDVIGRTLLVNGVGLTIVGVAPPGFHGTTVGTRASVFVPITFPPIEAPLALPDHANRSYYWVHLFARLAPTFSPEAAERAANVDYRRILNEIEAPVVTGLDEQGLQQFRAKSLVLAPGARGQSSLLVSVRARLQMLFAVSGAILLLCCANIVGLILIRGSTRRGELAVRAAMGATRRRLGSLLFAEALLLALPAALLAVPVALLTLQGVASGVPGVPSSAFDVEISLGAATLAIGVAVLSAVACGLLPLRGLTRTPTGRALQAYGARQTAGKNVTVFRTALASAQIALSMTLVALTIVFAQSLANIARIDLGFDVDPITTFTMSPETSGYSPESSATLYERVEQEIAAIPGVASVSSSMIQLLSGETFWSGVPVDGSEDRIGVHLHFIGRDFFQTLGIDLLAGRGFEPADSADSANTVVINQRLAERLGAGREVIGTRFRLLGRDVEVIGLVADAKDDKVTTVVEPQVFFPRAKLPGAPASFYIRSSQPSLSLIDAVRAALTRVDSKVPIRDLVTLQQQVRKSLTVERFVAASSTVFAVLGTVLAGLGIYGVLAYSVAQRSREIGLRIALGAAPARVRAMVFRQVAVMASLGVAIGMVTAFALGRAASGLLYGIEAGDPLSIVGGATVIALVTLSAAYFPARRASGVDPVVALRSE